MSNATCSIKGCPKPVKARGWCSAHYDKWHKYGDPLVSIQYRIPAGAVCSVSDCHKPMYARGWCITHYQRWSKRPDRSDPSVTLRPELEMAEEKRFWIKVNRDGPIPLWRPDLGPCWVWTASLDGQGYGNFRTAGQGHRAHRWSYDHIVGLIPEEKPYLDHLCRVPICVNPGHLEPVTFEENIRRGRDARIAMRGGKCVNGHEMTPENTYVWPDGKRTSCRACVRENQRRFRERQRGVS